MDISWLGSNHRKGLFARDIHGSSQTTMNSGKLVIIVLPSIIALIFSAFVTIGIMADISDRAEKAKQLKNKLNSAIVLTPSPPISSSVNPNTSSPFNPQVTP